MASPQAERRVSSFGSRRPEDVEQGPAPAVLPPIHLPPLRLQVVPEVDREQLAAAAKVVHDALYQAAYSGLSEAVRDFAAEQEAAAAESAG